MGVMQCVKQINNNKALYNAFVKALNTILSGCDGKASDFLFTLVRRAI